MLGAQGSPCSAAPVGALAVPCGLSHAAAAPGCDGARCTRGAGHQTPDRCAGTGLAVLQRQTARGNAASLRGFP